MKILKGNPSEPKVFGFNLLRMNATTVKYLRLTAWFFNYRLEKDFFLKEL